MSEVYHEPHDLGSLRPMTAQEVADLLGCKRGRVYDLLRQGYLPAIHLGRRVYIPRPAVLHLLAAGNGEEAEEPAEARGGGGYEW